MGRAPNTNENHPPEPRRVLGQAALRQLLALPAPKLLRAGPRRETFLYMLPGGEPVIVKRYGVRRRWEELREGLQGRTPSPPGRREYETLVALGAAGVPVPRPLDWHVEGSRSLVVMERLHPLVSLREHLTATPEDARQLFPRVLELVTRFHGAGWYHRDLYLDHLVLAGAPARLVLIDLERARRDVRPRRRWFIKDLAALWHSTPSAVGGRWPLAFLSRWLDAHGVKGRRRRRRWLRAILAKERRMAAHTPRGGTSYPAGR